MKFLLYPLLVIITSMFYFPFEFKALPGVNVKMMLAVVGLLFCLRTLLKRGSFAVPKQLLVLLAFAGSVSLASLFSITIHQTPDTTYVGYVTSFCVWLSAAYAVCNLIKAVHGSVTVRLVLDYLAAVCFFQCVAAIMIDNIPAFKAAVDAVIEQNQDLMEELERLYGIGASLDVAGGRFATVLVGLSFYLSDKRCELTTVRRAVYFFLFLSISIIGNMIARTTLVGMGVGMAFMAVGFFRERTDRWLMKRISSVVIVVLSITVSVWLYGTSAKARSLYRFGFEGFFSLVERGEWSVGSNEKLKTMIVLPETLHTWFLGDGYFVNSRNDINYLGNSTRYGYYMGTDIGYLRFIFYFGILGLIPMMGVIISSSIICIRCFRREALLFIMALTVGLIIWLKVATDIFCFLAPFLSTAALQGPNTTTIQNSKRYEIQNIY